jgi:hypothetical protein
MMIKNRNNSTRQAKDYMNIEGTKKKKIKLIAFK